MTKTKLSFAILLLLCSSVYFGFSQTVNDSVLFRAMEDEITRGMDQLEYKDYAKPCYISYEITDSKDLNIQAELGTISNSDTSNSRTWSFRLIVGSYELNDENFSGQNQGNMGMGGAPDILPIDNDYWGIRRSFWLNTNDIYLEAGANHREKLNLIEKGKIEADALKLDDFARADSVELLLPCNFVQPDIEKLEKKIAELSNSFYKYPELDFSTASMSFHQNIVYFISNEGTKFRIPVNSASIRVSVSKDIDDDNRLSSSFSYSAISPDDFPSNEVLLMEIETLIGDLMENEKAEKLEEDYTGPILILGDKACEVLMDNLFDYDKSLFAERNNLVVDYNGDVYFEEIDNEWQSKIDKKILGDGVTITALPKLSSWHGKPVLGGYPIDSEGIIPPDSIVLVEDGILKNMLSSRTPTNVTSVSNGHYPFTASYSGVSKSKSPSVIKIEDKNGLSEVDLKAKLIETAKEEELEFALIARTIPSNVVEMSYNIYKVDLETGEETILGNIYLNGNIEAKDMKKLVFGKETGLVNTGTGGYYDYGHLSSCIGPTALLIEEYEIKVNKERDKIHTAGDEITNPLELVDRSASGMTN
ncbi:MAG TPA: metallopeptidase TldD-related protein [Bacteroidales bacterium]|mgnify:CR=1 FL=1|nr:metallopeptidase TldD-related protein [Bacteroidales bacterium]